MAISPRNNCHDPLSRRDFVKWSVAAGVGARAALPGATATATTTQASDALFAAPPLERVRIGFVGVGRMGTNHVRNLLRIEGAVITAVCDIVEEHTTRAQDLVEEAGQPRPTGYSRGEYDFKRMCASEDLDLVFTATPWEWHVPVCVAAMENGKHAATEVPAAITLEGCWQLVETAEKHQKHCIMMENCCYGRAEMTTLNMVRRGVLGALVHGSGGYMHDIRAIFAGEHPGREWFQAHALERDGSLYATHGLGPVAQYMDINRGDRFESLVSMSSPSLGMSAYIRDKFPEDDPRQHLQFASGDVNTTLIRTALGRTITVVYNGNSPRPYSRINMIQGTKGIIEGYPDRVYIDGVSPGHDWEPMDNYWDAYEPELWRVHGSEAAGYGHGGMDYLENLRLIHCLRQGKPLDMDVYDAAAWSAVFPLSEKSVANGGAVIEAPDFTKGRWNQRPSLDVPGGTHDQQDSPESIK